MAPAIPPGATQSTINRPAPKNSRRYSARPANSSGSSTTIADADQRTQRAAGAAENDHQQKQDRLRERKRARRDEAGQRRLQSTGQTGRRGGQNEGHRAHRQRADPDAARGRRRRCRRLHGKPERASREIVEGDKRKRAETAGQQRRAAGIERRRNPGETARAPGQIAPLDRNRLDDEAESDRDHREIRAGDAKRGDREQRRYRHDQQHRERQRFPKTQTGLGRKDRLRRRRRAPETRPGRAILHRRAQAARSARRRPSAVVASVPSRYP